VALLSAGEILGAAHQRPQVFQVMINHPTSVPRPGVQAEGKPLDARWRLLINQDVDPDVTYAPDMSEPQEEACT